MSKTMYDRATRRDGPILWSGVESQPSELTRLKKDMEMELARALQMRSSVFDPCQIGALNGVTRYGGIHGSGYRVGSGFGAHVDFPNFGHTKAGAYQLAISAETNSVGTVLGPAAFEVHADKDLKYYFKGSIGDVINSDVFIGMAHDDTYDFDGAGGDGWPDLLTAGTGAFLGQDGIGLLFNSPAAATTAITFAVWDANASTNSQHTVTFPAVIDDDVVFEFGFHVHGTTAITTYAKVGDEEIVQRIDRVESSALHNLSTSLKRLGPGVNINIRPLVTGYVSIQAMSATQPM